MTEAAAGFCGVQDRASIESEQCSKMQAAPSGQHTAPSGWQLAPTRSNYLATAAGHAWIFDLDGAERQLAAAAAQGPIRPPCRPLDLHACCFKKSEVKMVVYLPVWLTMKTAIS